MEVPSLRLTSADFSYPFSVRSEVPAHPLQEELAPHDREAAANRSSRPHPAAPETNVTRYTEPEI